MHHCTAARHLENFRQADDLVISDLLQDLLCCPLIESLPDPVLERTLERDISDLQLACAVGGNEDEVDSWVVRTEKAAELLALVYRPHVKHEDDVGIRGETMAIDALADVRHDNVLDVLLHRLLVAPVVVAEGEMRLGSFR